MVHGATPFLRKAQIFKPKKGTNKNCKTKTYIDYYRIPNTHLKNDFILDAGLKYVIITKNVNQKLFMKFQPETQKQAYNCDLQGIVIFQL